MKKLSKLKKSIFGAIMVGTLLMPTIAAALTTTFVPLEYLPVDDYKYEGQTVQRTLEYIPMFTTPNLASTILMYMEENEAVVGAGTLSNGADIYRIGIAGYSVNNTMLEGIIPDWKLMKVDVYAPGVYATAPLTPRNLYGVAIPGLADIPAGSHLAFNRNFRYLRAYDNGKMVYIDGYYSGADWVEYGCYVNTNWRQGSRSNYWVVLN